MYHSARPQYGSIKLSSKERMEKESKVGDEKPKMDRAREEEQGALAYKRSAACKPAAPGLRAMREGAGIKDSQSTALNAGDWAIAVEWPERTGSDPNRPNFVPGDGVVSFVNSTELHGAPPNRRRGRVFPRAGGQQG